MADNLTPQEFALKKQKNQQNDLRNLLMATLLEARGEGEEGMFAVARSIHNRKNLIGSGQVPTYTFMPNSKNKKPSYTDIITHKDQYKVYDGEKKVFKRQKSKITQEDVNIGVKALEIALNDKRAKQYIKDKGLDARTYDAVNFRGKDAKFDASQQTEKFVVGNHIFNLSGSPFVDKYKNK
tara:strand:+ start:832 stop:1374 length:543 start_codon:yes stop_codon:yes gene_type:complete